MSNQVELKKFNYNIYHSEDERRKILRSLIDDESIEYNILVNWFKHLILLNQNNDRCKDVIPIWKSDLHYIITYKYDSLNDMDNPDIYRRYKIRIFDSSGYSKWVHVYGSSEGWKFMLTGPVSASKFPKLYLDDPYLMDYISGQKYKIVMLPEKYGTKRI